MSSLVIYYPAWQGYVPRDCQWVGKDKYVEIYSLATSRARWPDLDFPRPFFKWEPEREKNKDREKEWCLDEHRLCASVSWIWFGLVCRVIGAQIADVSHDSSCCLFFTHNLHMKRTRVFLNYVNTNSLLTLESIHDHVPAWLLGNIFRQIEKHVFVFGDDLIPEADLVCLSAWQQGILKLWAQKHLIRPLISTDLKQTFDSKLQNHCRHTFADSGWLLVSKSLLNEECVPEMNFKQVQKLF